MIDYYFADWQSVTSGVPQRSILGFLFVINVNDLNENVGDLLSKLKNNMKIGGVTNSKVCWSSIQESSDKKQECLNVIPVSTAVQ